MSKSLNRLQRKHICWWIIYLLIFLSLVGCQRYKVVNQINIVDIIGFDTAESSGTNNLLGGVLVHEFKHEEKDASLKPIFAEGKTVNESIATINKESRYPIEISKTTVLILTKEYVEKEGVKEIVDTICRDEKIGANMKVIISNDSLPDIFNKLVQTDAGFLYEMIENNMVHNNIPYSNLYVFLNNYHGHGRDPILPLVHSSDSGKILIKQVGVINAKDKLQITLDSEEVIYLKLMINQSKKIIFTIPIDKEGKEGTVTLTNLYGDSEILPHIKNNTVTFDVTMNCTIKDFPSWFDIDKESDYLEKQVKQYVNDNFQKIFKSFQENEIDPVGIGDMFRSKDRRWSEHRFYQQNYPSLELDTQITFHLLKSGLGESGGE